MRFDQRLAVVTVSALFPFTRVLEQHGETGVILPTSYFRPSMLQLRVKRTADANWMKLFGLKNQTRIKNFRKNTTGVKDQYRETEKA
jgi:hypothetical protein